MSDDTPPPSSYSQRQSEPIYQFLTVGELAAMLKVPVSTVRGWRKRGVGPPATPVGGAIRYRLSEVEEWLTGQKEADERAAPRPVPTVAYVPMQKPPLLPRRRAPRKR